jgi:hypothetical protein
LSSLLPSQLPCEIIADNSAPGDLNLPFDTILAADSQYVSDPSYVPSWRLSQYTVVRHPSPHRSTRASTRGFFMVG